jgi:NADH dehydrogenase
MSKQKVVIVGGGFGGVKAALELCDDNRFSVTLISSRKDFQYYPTLYHTVTGGLTAQSVIPLETIFADKPVRVVIDTATTLDKRAKTLTTESGVSYPYDNIILALGSVTNYFGIQGLQEYSYGMKSIEDIARLKDHIHGQLLAEHKPDLHYVIIGGGPTGIELAPVSKFTIPIMVRALDDSIFLVLIGISFTSGL